MVRDGFLDAGYEYVLIDDCWALSERENGTIIVDSSRFPNGFQSLTKYVHGKGLKIGIYTSVGSKTCAGFAYVYSPLSLSLAHAIFLFDTNTHTHTHTHIYIEDRFTMKLKMQNYFMSGDLTL